MEKIESQWKEVNEEELTLSARCVYRIRRRAVELYRKGGSAREIFCATGMNHMEVLRLWRRCCAKDPDTGECLGYRALVPKSKTDRKSVV